VWAWVAETVSDRLGHWGLLRTFKSHCFSTL
jgi:hypothetical protein